MSLLQSILTGGTSNLISSVGKVVDDLTTTREEKMTLENELQKAAWQHEQEMRKLEVQEQTQWLADKDSARNMGSRIQEAPQASSLSKNIAAYLAIAATLLTFGMLYAVVFDTSLFQNSNKETVLYVLGVVSTLLTQVFGYYFGSSLGSKEKNVLLGKG